jgi:hypothetical protein
LSAILPSVWPLGRSNTAMAISPATFAQGVSNASKNDYFCSIRL